MTTLYGISFSHPSLAARLMLERAGIEHRWVALSPGLHRLILRARGFPRRTVPALEWDRRRIQGSLEISRAIERAGPPGILFPVDPATRQRVEEAEAWGERELQPIPRKLFRWALWRHAWLRKAMARQSGLPWPALAGMLMWPVAWRFAHLSRADDASVLTDLKRLPSLLDRVDTLIAEGTIGGDAPNAADYQIGTSIRSMLSFEDLRPWIEGRPAEAQARRILPDYPGPIPSVLPPRRPSGKAGEAVVA